MACDDVDLLALLKGESNRAAEEHLALCGACQAEAERTRSILRVLQTEEWIEPGPAFTERVLNSVAEREEARPRPASAGPVRSLREFFLVLLGRSGRTIPAWALSAAVHLFIFGALALLLYTRMREEDDVVVLVENRTRGNEISWNPMIPKQIESAGPGGAPVVRPGSEPPDFTKGGARPGMYEPEIPGMAPPLPPPREEEERRHRLIEYQRTIEIGFWRSAEGRVARDRLVDPSGRYRKVVDRALEYLAARQSRSGMWEGDSLFAKDYEVGVAGLSLLAFLNRGSTHLEGPHRETVERGLGALRRLQEPHGRVGGERGNYMYNHAIATIALLEAYLRAGKDPDLLLPCHDAVRYLAGSQNSLGGWRYRRGEESADLSVTAWAVQALRLAVFAGFRPLAVDAIVRARGFVGSLRTGEGRYRYGEGFSQDEERMLDPDWWTTRLAMGMAAEMLSSHGVPSEQIRAQSEALLGETQLHRGGPADRNDLCRLVYGGLAMAQVQGDLYPQWWRKVAPELAALQQEDGGFPPTVDRWSGYGGPHYATAMAALALQSHHRFPALY